MAASPKPHHHYQAEPVKSHYRALELMAWCRGHRSRLTRAFATHGLVLPPWDVLVRWCSREYTISEGSANVDLHAQEYAWLVALARAMPPGWVCSLVRKYGPNTLDASWRLGGIQAIGELARKLPQATKEANSNVHPDFQVLTSLLYPYAGPHYRPPS